MKMLFGAVHESRYGTFRTSHSRWAMSVRPGEADIIQDRAQVRNWPRKRHAGVNGGMTAYRSKARASRAIAGAMI
jgi:hypothetical protein